MAASAETRPKLVEDGTIGRDSEPHLPIVSLRVKTDTDSYSPTTFAPVAISESTISSDTWLEGCPIYTLIYTQYTQLLIRFMVMPGL